MPSDRKPKASQKAAPSEPRKPVARARITNGSEVVAGVDGRTLWVRRLRDLMALHVRDLGGDEALSEAQRSIVRRAATLTVELERMERDFALAGEADPDALERYQRASNTLRRLLETIGLERRQRDVTPTLSEYLSAMANGKGGVA